MSLARWWRGRIGRSRVFRGEAKDVNANQQGSHDRQAEGEQLAINRSGLDVPFFERHIRVARLLARVVGLSAHDAQWPPPILGRPAGESGTASS